MTIHSTPISSSTFPIYESIVNTNRFTSVDLDTHECAIWLQLRQDREYYEMDGRVGVSRKSLVLIGTSTNKQGIGCRSRKKGKIVRLKGFGSQTLVKWIIWTGIS